MLTLLRSVALLALGPVVERLGAEIRTEEQARVDDGILLGRLIDLEALTAERDFETARADALAEELREIEKLLRALSEAKPGSDAETDARWGIAAWVTTRLLGGSGGEQGTTEEARA